ncbi:hypothetical protein HFP57_04710 [Parasphingopyxis algicola]|uniref:hypothetical protein n=1 Tax=Parasphingopyxis algicola TaxID=2026624 RepID=UPI00159F9C88|nr:hypothetical protein [Parasphingopyxis algicola]QLC24398.1 hypothetical protein HFP57_04710 [Parasphingopyxis algicola]
MENDRLARAIARIEQAADRLGNAKPAAAPVTAPAEEAGLAAELESMKAAHKAALEDRERTIAKLQADFADVGKLKDEEIERLRGELQAKDASLQSPVSEAEYRTLQDKYERLRATAETTLTGLDAVIGKVESADNG